MDNSPRDIKKQFINIGKGILKVHWSVWLTIVLLAIFIPFVSLYFTEIQFQPEVYSVLHTVLNFFQSAVIFSVFCVIIINKEFRDIWVFILSCLTLLFYVVVGVIQEVLEILSLVGNNQFLYFDSDAWLTILSAMVLFFLTFMFFLKEVKRIYKILFICVFVAIDTIILLDFANIIEISFSYWMITVLIIIDITVFFSLVFYQKKLKIKYPKNTFSLFVTFSILYHILMYIYLIHGISNGEIIGHTFAVFAHLIALLAVFRTLVDYPYHKLKDTVSEQNRTFDIVTTLINHDVANLLAVAAGAIDISIDTKDSDILERAASSVQNAQILIRRLVEAGREIINSEKKTIDVYAGTLAIIDEIKKSHDFPDKNFNIICEKFDLKIYGYDILLQIIYNFITNAIKHTSKKNVTIWIRFQDRKKAEGDYKLIVEDDGDGIPPERKKKLLKKPVVSKEGFGMSLFLAGNLIAEHFNGNITIENRVKNDYTKGAKFIISLPVPTKDEREMLKS